MIFKYYIQSAIICAFQKYFIYNLFKFICQLIPSCVQQCADNACEIIFEFAQCSMQYCRCKLTFKYKQTRLNANTLAKLRINKVKLRKSDKQLYGRNAIFAFKHRNKYLELMTALWFIQRIACYLYILLLFHA